MIETSPTLTKFADAFHKAQSEMEGVHKDSANPHFRSRYASLENVVNTARPVLSKFGLSWTQHPGPMVDGRLTVTTRLMHVSGEWMQSTFHMAVAKPDPQGIGSATTYACRYSLMAILGLPPTDDDDGEAAMGRASSVAPKPKAKAREDYSVFENEIRECKTPEMLKLWSRNNRERIGALPDDWRENLREEYEDHMQRLVTMMAGTP
jgi:hypothetical protein